VVSRLKTASNAQSDHCRVSGCPLDSHLLLLWLSLSLIKSRNSCLSREKMARSPNGAWFAHLDWI
jgi:hypothetical protein